MAAGPLGRQGSGAVAARKEFGPASVARRDRDYARDRKSTRLNSSHLVISYAVFCLKKTKETVRGGLERRLPFGSDLRDERKVPALAHEFHAIPHEDAFLFFFFNETATPDIYPLPLQNPLPI